MNKKVTTRLASPPAASDSSGTSTKNDSFLEDMELISHNSKICISGKEAERFITRRTLSPGMVPFSAVTEEEDIPHEKTSSQNMVHQKLSPSWKPTHRKTSNTDKARSSGDGNSQTGISTAKGLKAKIQKINSRSFDNQSKTQPGDIEIAQIQAKLQNDSNKLHQDRKSLVKDRSRRSRSYKESDQSAEAFKENKQPSNSHKQINSLVEASSREHLRRSDSRRKSDTGEMPEPIGLLNAVKEIVSTYTREEGMKISRTLNELHILSQSSLIKNLMFATDEIKRDLQIGENLGQLKVLLAENERLRENFVILKIKNDDLQKRLEETENIKEENARLKLRLQELIGRRSS